MRVKSGYLTVKKTLMYSINFIFKPVDLVPLSATALLVFLCVLCERCAESEMKNMQKYDAVLTHVIELSRCRLRGVNTLQEDVHG